MMLSGRVFAFLLDWPNLPFPTGAATPPQPSPLGKVAERSEVG